MKHLGLFFHVLALVVCTILFSATMYGSYLNAHNVKDAVKEAYDKGVADTIKMTTNRAFKETQAELALQWWVGSKDMI